ncbi:small membrane A-kinase anchor protein isoform X1 [Poecile atricapillus]|uniref:small membrane A-kinase anchor protein isoform X1 n=1 Tax=Poecile atricapillus TaxID=48891 RepID=UPI002738B49D|nr:small membrane A-kinase anchor protein isoform X1 [Poecile atricapillus]
MDFDGGFASLPFRSPEEAAASVGRGPDPAGTAGGRGSPAAGDRARRGHASSMLLARTPPRRAGQAAVLLYSSHRLAARLPATDSSKLSEAEVPLPLGTLRKGGATDGSESDAEWEGKRRGWFSPSGVPAVGKT